MRIENMRAFIEVANCGSMTTAANALFTSAQNVSKTICQIENELGVQLLVRSRKGCTLTGEGERFYSVCVPILRQWESYVQPLNPLLPSKIRGTIRIAASLYTIDFIANESRLFQREYPNIKVELVEQLGGASTTKQRVQDTCDIICFACDEESLEMFRQQQRNRLLYLIKKEPLRLFFSKDNPLLKNADVVTNKLLESCPLAHCRDFDIEDTMISRLLAERGVKPNYVFASNNVNLCYEYILKEDAGFLSTSFTFAAMSRPTHFADITSLPLRDKINICHTLSVKKSGASSAALLFIDQLQSRVKMKLLTDQ